MSQPNDRLVDGYLDAVARAAADLPADHRDDLLADLRGHIAAARADLVPETGAGVRTILDRLGAPDAIAAEARLGMPTQVVRVPAPRRGTGNVLLVVVAVVLLVCGVGAALLLAVR